MIQIRSRIWATPEGHTWLVARTRPGLPGLIPLWVRVDRGETRTLAEAETQANKAGDMVRLNVEGRWL